MGLDQGNICIFGAGGPVGAAAQLSLKNNYTLRLTDLRDVVDIVADGEAQSKGAPLPEVPEPPHEWRQVDVGDYAQVRAAAEGMDALINVSVLRHDLVPAFRVNTVGAYNVMKAAVACGINKVIHTGPRHTRLGFEGDYWPDFDIPDEAPLHPGSDLYALTKCLGGEIVQTFAERHDMDVITFLYCSFRPADGGQSADGSGVHPFAISWEDTGDPFLHALRADRMPTNYEVFDIHADLPHGKFGTSKVERLLGWKPKHNLERLYRKDR
jgi:nucleoside-diphosphate-sugar epimerase